MEKIFWGEDSNNNNNNNNEWIKPFSVSRFCLSWPWERCGFRGLSTGTKGAVSLAGWGGTHPHRKQSPEEHEAPLPDSKWPAGGRGHHGFSDERGCDHTKLGNRILSEPVTEVRPPLSGKTASLISWKLSERKGWICNMHASVVPPITFRILFFFLPWISLPWIQITHTAHTSLRAC